MISLGGWSRCENVLYDVGDFQQGCSAPSLRALALQLMDKQAQAEPLQVYPMSYAIHQPKVTNYTKVN